MKSKFYDLGGAILHAGDCTEILPMLGAVADAIVTDPPYHLTSGNAVYDLRLTGSGNPRTRRTTQGGGFMGKAWDGGDVAFRPETWAAAYSALKPGGYLLAFGGSRTHHHIWSAIEDAGFVIQDTIMWIYGSGLPKGRTQLKPAFEPICVAYKPGGKRELQIDECRVPGPMDGVWGTSNATVNRQRTFNASPGAGEYVSAAHQAGRWPANIAHDGSDEAMEAFAAFGSKTSGVLKAGTERTARSVCYGPMPKVAALQDFGGDTGTAARFYYCAKANKADRAGSKHPTVKPIALMRWLVRLVTQPGGTVLDPFAGSGTTGAAALAEGRKAILIEREPEYISDIRRRLKAYKVADSGVRKAA